MPEQTPSDADLAAPDVEYVARVRRLRREVAGAVLLVYLGSLVLFVGLIGLLNVNSSWYPGNWDRLDFDTGLGGGDALVVNLGLATFVAALSIALVQLRPASTQRQGAPIAAVWAEQASVLLVLACTLAVVLSWSQVLSPSALQEPGLAFTNVALGILVTWSALAIRGWAGMPTHLGPLRRTLVADIERRLATLKKDRRRGRSNTTSRFVAFVFLVTAVTTAPICGLLAYRDVATAADVSWWAILALVAWLAAATWFHVSLAIAQWSAQLRGSWADRIPLAAARALLNVLFIILFGVFAIVEPAIHLRLIWLALAFSPGAVTWALLGTARRTRTRTGQFAVQRAINAGEQAAGRIRADLDALHDGSLGSQPGGAAT